MRDADLSREALLVELERMREECDRLQREARPVQAALKASLESEQRHQQALRALQESEARFRALTDAALDAIFCKDLDRRYTFINPYMERMLGKKRDEILGRTPEEVFAPENGGHRARG